MRRFDLTFKPGAVQFLFLGNDIPILLMKEVAMHADMRMQ